VVQYIKEGVYSDNPPLLTPPLVTVQPTTQSILDGLEKLRDVNFRKKIAKLQYNHVKEYHNAEKLAKRLIEIYEGLL